MTISAVLLNWRRPWNMPLIVESLEGHVDRIVIWDNSGKLSLNHPDVDVLRSSRNENVYGRFLAAKSVGSEFIFTQDDDYIVENVGEVIRSAAPDKLVVNLPRYRHEQDARDWAFLGFGAVFPRKTIGVLDRWITVYGEGDLLKRKADRIYTILGPEKHYVRGDVRSLFNPDGHYSRGDKNSLWKRDDHHRLTKEAVRKAVRIRDGA